MTHTAGFEEWLVPVVVFVIWAINAAISAAKNKSESDRPKRPLTPLNHPANDDSERTRRIQEEIRRKIAERRGETIPQPQQSGPVQYPQEQQPPPIRRTVERMPSPLEAPRPMTSSREVAHRRQPTPRPTGPMGPFGQLLNELMEPQRNYEAELAEQRRQAEEAQRKAEAIRRQTLAQTAQKRRAPILEKTTGGNFKSIRGNLRRELQDPAAVRKAVLHYEILGTPVGMRRNGQLYPHWEV